mgnify:CR=1 FL=1
MNLKIKSITALLFLFLITSYTTFSQDLESRVKTQYSYTLQNISSSEQISTIVSEIENIQFVEKVKLNMKDEASGKAQLIIYINEPARTSESQIMFQPTALKKTIFIDGINLLELKTTTY